MKSLKREAAGRKERRACSPGASRDINGPLVSQSIIFRPCVSTGGKPCSLCKKVFHALCRDTGATRSALWLHIPTPCIRVFCSSSSDTYLEWITPLHNYPNESNIFYQNTETSVYRQHPPYFTSFSCTIFGIGSPQSLRDLNYSSHLWWVLIILAAQQNCLLIFWWFHSIPFWGGIFSSPSTTLGMFVGSHLHT